jgi:cytochrome c oxidase subunit 3
VKALDILLTKPWLQPSDVAGVSPEYVGPDIQAASRIVLRFIMVIVSVLFFLFIITFLSRSQYPDFQALAGAPWQPFTDPSRLWFNTALLVCSSLAMQIALGGARKGRQNVAIWGLSAGVFFTVMFLVAQLDLWMRLQAMGFYINGNPANSYFYVLTAIHGLHLMGGLIVLASAIFRVWYDNNPGTLGTSLQLCTTYWHFLLVVWLVLFALLTSQPETINALAAMCGF